MTNRTNGSLRPGRWRRDREAELELLALLDRDSQEDRLTLDEPPPAERVERVPFDRAVFPMELRNR